MGQSTGEGSRKTLEASRDPLGGGSRDGWDLSFKASCWCPLDEKGPPQGVALLPRFCPF